MLIARPSGGAFARASPARSTPSPVTSSAPPAVVGTAPDMQRHLLIHTPHRATSWPSHLDSVSPLYRALAHRWANNPKLADIAFNFTDAGTGQVEQEWDPTRGKFEEPPADAPQEHYSATLYPDFLSLPSISLSSLDALESQLVSLPPAPSFPVSPPSPSPSPSSTASPTPPRTHIFICTHSSRDCRCGDLGEPLYLALVRELRRRNVVEGGELRDGEAGVRVARVAHVGGHKWAGNALLYREGVGCDWYGLLRAEDAPHLLSLALSSSPAPWHTRWRGRVGLSPSAVRAAFAERPAGEASAQGKADEPRGELGERVGLVFRTFEGEEVEVAGYEGESVMEVAKRHSLPSILATCGGHCECATCHVHLAEDAPQPEMRDEEDEQLEFAIGADDDSRLACQLPVTKELGEWVAQGGRIRLPRY
ncbi:Sucrase/ferredoxin-like-domain-containing protein [Rhodotorula diobovata]|uniref:Sucrase/ferredoxin-like-domain-containing protein n=1 Tax=Rhodotorula diobovata TaxID=5288 RepID=A0A5C5FW63_9BASI|nr:Sucrase/ferredoxin-like-domain-containing protein [Rhodotorula diobovata]